MERDKWLKFWYEIFVGSQVTGYPKASAGPQEILKGKMHKSGKSLNIGMAGQTSAHPTDLDRAELFTKQQFTKNSVKGPAERFLTVQRMVNEQ